MSQQNQAGSQPEPVPVQPVPVQPAPVPAQPRPVSPDGGTDLPKADSPEAGPQPVPVPVEDVSPSPVSEEPLSLVEEESNDGSGMSRIRARAPGSPLGQEKRQFERPLNINKTGATRCRIFHSRVALAPLDHMQTNINEWLDSEEIEVKHVGHLVGVMEGKSPEPNLLVMVWY